MQEHRAGKDQKDQTAFALGLEGVEFLSPPTLTCSRTYLHNLSLPCAHPSKGDGFLLRSVFFLPSTDVRLERELIYDSQFDERPRGRKKRSFFSENEHQRLGKKKKRKWERGVGGREWERTTRETTTRESKSTASTRTGDEIAPGAIRWKTTHRRYLSYFRNVDVTLRDAECLRQFKITACVTIAVFRILIYCTRERERENE